MFFYSFKIKHGRCCETKNVDQSIAKKKDKSSKVLRQPLVLYQQQLCKYHQAIVNPSIYPGDKPVMATTIDPIVPLPSKITSVLPKLVSVSVDEPVPVPDDKAELEKIVESSDGDLD